MGIKLEDQALLLTLDDALALARSTEELPALWIARVERLGGLGIKTYIAALGGAPLAKATDPRVDSLAPPWSAATRPKPSTLGEIARSARCCGFSARTLMSHRLQADGGPAFPSGPVDAHRPHDRIRAIWAPRQRSSSCLRPAPLAPK